MCMVNGCECGQELSVSMCRHGSVSMSNVKMSVKMCEGEWARGSVPRCGVAADVSIYY